MDIRCTNCGADVPIEPRARVVKCPFCAAALVVDLSAGISHLVHDPEVERGAILGHLEKKLALLETRGSPEVAGADLIYVPYWRAELRGGARRLFCAAIPPAEVMDEIRAPEGAGRYYDEDSVAGKKVVEPTILADAARARFAAGGVDWGEDDGAALSMVHLPLWEVSYECAGERHQAWVDAVGGEVHADTWPRSAQRQKDVVFGAVGVVSLAAFFAEAILVPGLWILLAFPVTAAVLYLSTRTMLGKLGW